MLSADRASSGDGTAGFWFAACVGLLLVSAPLIGVTSAGFAGASNGPGATLNYTIDPASYNNTVHVAPSGALLAPRIAMDRSPGSPRFGTLYVVGVNGTSGVSQLQNLVVAKSSDGGATFSPLIQVDLNLTSEFAPGANPFMIVRDLAVTANGTLAVDVLPGMRGILESWNGGLAWSYQPVWNDTLYVWALTSDVVTGRLYAVVRQMGAPTPLLLTSSMDGLNWAPPRVVPVANASSGQVQLAAHAGVVLVSYVSCLSACGTPWPSPFAVIAVTSQDDGLSWSDSVIIDESPYYIPRPQTYASLDGVFGVAWETLVSNATLNQMVPPGQVRVAVSADNGRSFVGHLLSAAGSRYDYEVHGVPLVLDNRSRVYVAWTTYAFTANATQAALHAAVNGTDSADFQNASFTTLVEYGNSNWTNQEDLGLGLNDTVYLVWSAINFDANNSVVPETSGIFLRAVAGAAGGQVYDPEGVFGGSSPYVELRNMDGRIQVRAAWKGIPLEILGLPPQNYSVWIVDGPLSLLAGPMSVRIWGLTTFTISVNSGGSTSWSAWILPTIAAGAILGVGAFLASLYYTRLTRENVFQQKQRLLLYEYVRVHPGTTSAEIRRTFGLQNGVAAYHLDVLERQGFLHTEARRGHRWYYPSGDASLWRDIPLSPLQFSIVDAVTRRPGIGIRELSRTVDRRSSSVAENVKSLEREGVLRTERSGVRLRCYPPERTRTAKSPDSANEQPLARGDR